MKKLTFVITGGADGLGRELCAKFSSKNTVVILDHNQDKLHLVAQKLDCAYHYCDVTDVNSIKTATQDIVDQYGHIDVLINCAGVYIDGPITSCDPEKIKQVFEVNTIGTALMCRFVAKVMKRQKSGVIINLNSQAGLAARAKRSIYHASKWAITGLTRSLQPELAPFGIKVLDICPGQLKTKFRQKAGCKNDKNRPLDPEYIVKIIDFVLSLGPDITVQEISVRHFPD
jgi:NAD(P)-dependent dehydrogenase (short-subunit alcohol dehydrogenase family)